MDSVIIRDPFQPQLFCDSDGGSLGVASSKNSKVYKAEELNLQVTVLLCVHTVRVVTVRTVTFVCYMLGICGCRVPAVSLGQHDLMRSLPT